MTDDRSTLIRLASTLLKQFVTRIDSMGVPEKEEAYDFRIHLRPS